MSYILDALKKAESERNLGSVPNVHAQAPHGSANADTTRWSKLLPWSLTALALGILLLALAWLQPWRQQAPAAPLASTSAVTPTITPTATSAITPAVTPVPAVTVQPVITEPPPAPHPAVAQVKTVPVPLVSKPTPQPAVKSPPIAATADKPIATPASPPVVTAAAATEAKTTPDDKEVGTAKELPQYIQAQLPAVVVNGYLYAKDPADRSVLINQKLLHEGDSITSDLLLEKMLPKGAILNFKGYRYRIAF